MFLWIKGLVQQFLSTPMVFRQLKLAFKSNFKILVLSWTHDEASLKQKLRQMSPEELKELGLNPLNFKRK